MSQWKFWLETAFESIVLVEPNIFQKVVIIFGSPAVGLFGPNSFPVLPKDCQLGSSSTTFIWCSVRISNLMFPINVAWPNLAQSPSFSLNLNSKCFQFVIVLATAKMMCQSLLSILLKANLLLWSTQWPDDSRTIRFWFAVDSWNYIMLP